MKRFAWAMSLVFLTACAGAKKPPLAEMAPCQLVKLALGPEDLALDQNRILVSVDDRRQTIREGAILALDIHSGTFHPLTGWQSEPQIKQFHPQGIDLIEQDGVRYLFVVLKRFDGQNPAIARFKVNGDHLEAAGFWRDQLRDPNDLVARPEGGFYVTDNDPAMINNLMGSGRILLFINEDKAQIVADGLTFANGLALTEGHLFGTTSLLGDLYSWEIGPKGELNKKLRLANIPGGDNLSINGGILLIAGHPCKRCFMSHAKSTDKHSPSQIWAYNIEARQLDLVLEDPMGKKYSAASVAIATPDRLILGQVFDGQLLSCPLPAPWPPLVSEHKRVYHLKTMSGEDKFFYQDRD